MWDLLLMIGALIAGTVFAVEGMAVSALIAFLIAAFCGWMWIRE